ncbi:MAG: bifunctional [glutamate--ammonia ligase]-adenylyl-L-tyrosine phosphorylase/[glutamate--ammonia-ligase] adenylyltransferase [bacterium]
MADPSSNAPFPPTEPKDELRAVGFEDPTRAERNLAKLGRDPSYSPLFSHIRPLLLHSLAHCPDPDMALNNLEAYADKVLDPRFFYSLLRDNPRVLDLIIAIFSHSQFLADILLHHPQYLYWLLEPGQLRRAKLKEEMAEELGAAVDAKGGLEEKIRALRLFNRREILRIGVADVLDNLDLVDVTQQLSSLAEVTLQKAFEATHAHLLRRHGKPQLLGSDGLAREASFTILGLGKLGGGELNFSSDIDIIYLYSEEGETLPSSPEIVRVDNRFYFSRLAEMINKAIADPSEEGHCFRVDLRLRPRGRSGDLALSLRGYEIYYETQGQTWERQALLKARPVAGDEALGKEFLQVLTPFIFRQHLDYQAISEIKAMKERINLSIALDPGSERDVKLGPGGIREIEFIVQAFQLIHGGQRPWIREPNTLRALHRLAGERFLPTEEYSGLVKAYTFLRRVEHRLQLLHQIRTHRLPETQKEMVKLAKRLGYHRQLTSTPAEDFLHDLREHTGTVKWIYDRLFYQRPSVGAATSVPSSGEREVSLASSDLSLLLEDPEGGAMVRQRLKEAGVADVERGYRNLLMLKEGPSGAQFALSESRRLPQLLPLLLEALKSAPDADMALNSFEQFVRAMGARDSLFSLFSENPGLLNVLIRLFGHSEFLAQLLILHPDLMNLFLYPVNLERRKSRAEMKAELSSLLAEADSPLSRLDALRHFKKSQELRIGIREILGKADIDETFHDLTDVADLCLGAALQMASAETEARYGIPEVKEEDRPSAKSHLTLIGLGKLGGVEFNFGSDLDILFVYGEEGQTTGIARENSPATEVITLGEYYSRLAHRTLRILTTLTKEGAAYRVDVRLRPGGQKGELAQSLDSYSRHFESMAELWERQALVKARVVAGDQDLGHLFLERVNQFVYGRLLSPEEIGQMAEMRDRMGNERGAYHSQSLDVKLGVGGIADIEFIVQMLQLHHGQKIEALRTPHTLKALEKLPAHGLLSAAEAEALKDSYLFMRRVENRLRILSDQPIDALPSSPEKINNLAKRMGYIDQGGGEAGRQLLFDLQAHQSKVRELFRLIFARESLP